MVVSLSLSVLCGCIYTRIRVVRYFFDVYQLDTIPNNQVNCKFIIGGRLGCRLAEKMVQVIDNHGFLGGEELFFFSNLLLDTLNKVL